MKKNNYKIGIYLRTAQKDDDSIKRQKDLNISYCRSRGYSKVVKIYEDNGVSDIEKNRFAYKELLKDIKKRKINVIMVSDFSRLTRNPIYFFKKNYKNIIEEKLIIICVNSQTIIDKKTYINIIPHFDL